MTDQTDEDKMMERLVIHKNMIGWLYSKRLEAGLFYHTKNQVQSLSSLRGEVWRGVSYLVKL